LWQTPHRTGSWNRIRRTKSFHRTREDRRWLEPQYLHLNMAVHSRR
jgi:hypothetical protein